MTYKGVNRSGISLWFRLWVRKKRETENLERWLKPQFKLEHILNYCVRVDQYFFPPPPENQERFFLKLKIFSSTIAGELFFHISHPIQHNFHQTAPLLYFLLYIIMHLN